MGEKRFAGSSQAEALQRIVYANGSSRCDEALDLLHLSIASLEAGQVLARQTKAWGGGDEQR